MDCEAEMAAPPCHYTSADGVLTFTRAGHLFWRPRFERHGFELELQMCELAFQEALAEVLVAELMAGRMVRAQAQARAQSPSGRRDAVRLAFGIPPAWPPPDVVGNLVPVEFSARPQGVQAAAPRAAATVVGKVVDLDVHRARPVPSVS